MVCIHSMYSTSFCILIPTFSGDEEVLAEVEETKDFLVDDAKTKEVAEVFGQADMCLIRQKLLHPISDRASSTSTANVVIDLLDEDAFT